MWPNMHACEFLLLLFYKIGNIIKKDQSKLKLKIQYIAVN